MTEVVEIREKGNLQQKCYSLALRGSYEAFA